MGVMSPILFWPLAALLSGGAVVLVIWFASRAAQVAGKATEDPARAVYRRQLADLDELVDRGVLAADEREAARAEAARRLLAQDEPQPETSGARLWPFAAAGAAALGALALYFVVGSPGTADQPYRARLKQWRSEPITQLQPQEVAAVLREIAKSKPNDARLLGLLGRVERQAGDPVAAARDFQRAAQLNPGDADAYALLGELLMAASGDKPSPEAEAALKKALALDPKNQSALYYLGGARAAAGDRQGAASLWRQLAGQLPDNDARRKPLLEAAQRIATGAPPTAAPAAAEGGAEQGEFIKRMVASLKARLDANPDDPAGWARLVRSYRVLGDVAAEQAALARARSLFKARPKDLATVEAEAR